MLTSNVDIQAEIQKLVEKSESAQLPDGLKDKRYTEDSNSSSLEIVLENRGLLPYQNIDVSVILSDINGNAIGFSKTKIDSINAKNDREIASYTWPINRDNNVTSIEVFPIINPIFLNR
jgi:uncharacterized membrane protein